MPYMRFTFLRTVPNTDEGAQRDNVEYVLNRFYGDANVFEVSYVETLGDEYDPLPDEDFDTNAQSTEAV